MIKHAEFHSSEFYTKNILIAQKYLKQYHLLMDSRSVILDCCFFPSFHWKAYYMQVCRSVNGYIGHFACTYYADYWGVKSTSPNFLEIEDASQHVAKRGDVSCKIIQLDRSLMDNLIDTVKLTIPPEPKNGIMLDGIYANIRLFQNGEIVSDIRINHESTIMEPLMAISKQL